MPSADFEPAIPAFKRHQNYVLVRGNIGARIDTTQQSGQIIGKAVDIKHIIVYVSGYIETDTTRTLSPPTVWRQQTEFFTSRHSGQKTAAVRIGLECCCTGLRATEIAISLDRHVGLNVATRVWRCMPRQMLVCCVMSVLVAM